MRLVRDAKKLEKMIAKNGWCDKADDEQWARLRLAMDKENFCPIEEVTDLIWILTSGDEWSRRDILHELHYKASFEYEG